MSDVVVLGANGFVGSHLVRALLETADLRPVALVRAGAGNLPSGVERRRADATQVAALRPALAGADYAVNCVAGPPNVMVAATQALCDVANETGLRVVHLSSMAVYGEATGLVAESHALDPSGGGYAQAKVESERLVAACANAVILRPGCVHGPGSQQWTGRIARLLRLHRIGDLGVAGDGYCNLTFVTDLVNAILAALRQPSARGGVFNVSDPDPGTWNDYFRHLALATGAVPVRRISGRWLRLESKLAAPLKLVQLAAARVPVPLPVPDAITPSLARLWRQDIVLEHHRADADLGFPRTDPAQAIAQAAAWMRGV